MAESDVVLADIIRYVTDCLASPVTGVQPIERGYLNRKWVVQTDLGSMFVKQYHKGRYPDEKLASVEEALRRQNELYRAGVACPRVYESESGPIQACVKTWDTVAPGEDVRGLISVSPEDWAIFDQQLTVRKLETMVVRVRKASACTRTSRYGRRKTSRTKRWLNYSFPFFRLEWQEEKTRAYRVKRISAC